MHKSVVKMAPHFDIPRFSGVYNFYGVIHYLLSQFYQTNGRFSMFSVGPEHGTRMTFCCWISKIIMKFWMSVWSWHVTLFYLVAAGRGKWEATPKWRDLTWGHVPREWRLVLSALPNLHWSVDLYVVRCSASHFLFRFFILVIEFC